MSTLEILLLQQEGSFYVDGMLSAPPMFFV
jgi:hypothetical protein